MKTKIFIFLLLSAVLSSQNYKAVVHGTLLNTKDKKVVENSVVVIKDNLIEAVGVFGKVQIPPNAEIIDATGKFLIPGLIDGHIHFFQSGGLYTRPDGLDLRQRVPYKEKELKWIRDNFDDVFRRYIACGVTSVVDLGGPMWNFDIKEKAKNSEVAPNIFICGPLIASYQPDALTTDDPPIIKVTTIDEALALVKKQIEQKSDFIKIWYVVSKKNSSALEEFYPIVKAVVDESHKNNLPVYIHATELETARKSLEAGCDVLVHDVLDKPVDKDFLKKCRKNNVSFIPTLWVFNSYSAVYSKQLHLLKEEHLWGNPKIISSFFDMYEVSDSELGERQKKLQSEMKPIEPDTIGLQNLKAIQDYGINVVVGTDAGNVGVVHGPAIFHDFLLMNKAGIGNFDILKDATFNAAKMLRKENELGTIETGKLADLVVLNSNPLDNIMNTSDINLVFKSGRQFKPNQVVKKSPEDLAQIQLNAYNARDLDAFLETYDGNVEVYMFPDSLMFKGIEKMKEVYSNFFGKNKSIHCQLVNRIVNKNFVIDHERITGNTTKGTFEAVAIYEIAGEKIKKVWFVPK